MKYADAIAYAERLLERSLELGALQYGEFTLSAGSTTNFYFDGRLLTTDGEGVEILAALFLDILMRREIHYFGGPAVAAVPIIGGVVLAAHQRGYDLKGYFVRSEQKSYGLEKKIEGHLSSGDRVALWDDTLSTGSALLDALDAVAAVPANVDLTLCIMDRHHGGTEKLRERSMPLFNILASNSEGRVEVDTTILRAWFD